MTDEEEGEDDAPHEEPATNLEVDDEAVILWTALEDTVCPILGGQHGDGGEDIRNINKERLDDDEV